MTARLLAAWLVLGASAALACDKLTRTTTFLGWTADSRLFAWRVHETCEGCRPKWVYERTFVRSTGGAVTEYVTRYEHLEYPRPDLPDGKAFEAWRAQHPLLDAPPKGGPPALSMRSGGIAVKPRRDGELCAPREADVHLETSRSSRAWHAPSAACGCARGFSSPDGAFVAWLTGPARRTCDDCHGQGCCGDVEVLVAPQDERQR